MRKRGLYLQGRHIRRSGKKVPHLDVASTANKHRRKLLPRRQAPEAFKVCKLKEILTEKKRESERENRRKRVNATSELTSGPQVTQLAHRTRTGKPAGARTTNQP